MGNCVSISSTPKSVSNKTKALPIDSTFNLPSPLPSWPPGEGFATGTIDLGGLIVAEVTTFNKIWATYEGGQNNAGATFFEPYTIPEGFFVLGFYAQPNNRSLFGRILVGKDASDPLNPALKRPSDYVLVWTSNSLSIKQDYPCFIWAPIPQDGYEAVGLVVTTTSEKPSIDRIQCVRLDLTSQCEPDEWIWGREVSGSKSDEFNIFETRPVIRGKQASPVSVGTFMARSGDGTKNNIPVLACLKDVKGNFSYMPNMAQVEIIIQTFSPKIYHHPYEEYLPSSVNWFFTNGALLYEKGHESNPIHVEPTGSNLPQGGSNDGSYWLDLPIDDKAEENVKKGDLGTTSAYFHLKPILGGTYTDVAIWLFYPFNGPARAKVGILNVPLGKIGQHVGDWEHITLRVSNFNGMLRKAYLSQHSGGQWVHSPDLEFQDGNKIVGYASLHGHACYPRAGLVLQGNGLIGIRNDTGKSNKIMDTGKSYIIISGDYLGVISEPSWLNYARKWGPKITYDIADEIDKVAKILPGKLKSSFRDFIKSLPSEILGEEGPTGPKMKRNWDGDET